MSNSPARSNIREKAPIKLQILFHTGVTWCASSAGSSTFHFFPTRGSFWTHSARRAASRENREKKTKVTNVKTTAPIHSTRRNILRLILVSRFHQDSLLRQVFRQIRQSPRFLHPQTNHPLPPCAKDTQHKSRTFAVPASKTQSRSIFSLRCARSMLAESRSLCLCCMAEVSLPSDGSNAHSTPTCDGVALHSNTPLVEDPALRGVVERVVDPLILQDSVAIFAQVQRLAAPATRTC